MKISIVGCGRAGKSMGRLFREAGHEIVAVTCRTEERARAAADFVGATKGVTDVHGAVDGVDLVLLGVPDDEIEKTARSLSEREGRIMVHLSGVCPAGLLRPHSPVGAIHPMRSFADPDRAARQFPGTFCALDGDDAAVAVLEQLVIEAGGRPARVRSEGKGLYHAGAIVASNYVVTLFWEAKKLLEKAGLSGEAAQEALAGLLQGTASNISGSGVPAALTGPIDRGDVGTVRRHLEALAEADEKTAAFYRLLGKHTLEVAAAKGHELPEALMALLG